MGYGSREDGSRTMTEGALPSYRTVIWGFGLGAQTRVALSKAERDVAAGARRGGTRDARGVGGTWDTRKLAAPAAALAACAGAGVYFISSKAGRH